MKNDTLFSSTKRYNICKVYGFLSFTKNIGKNISKNLSSNYSRENLDHAKQSATDTFKTSSKIVIQKTAEATIGNKIADKITKSSPQKNVETIEEILRKKYISPELGQKIIDDLRLKED